MPNETETLFPLAASPAELATQAQQEPSLGVMLGKFIESGITDSNIAAFERMLAMKERMDAKEAEKQFAVAFNALQSELSPIQANKAVPNNDGTTRYKFAPFEDIMEAVRPLLQKHGFTVTFSMSFSEGRVIQTCILQHVGGHSRSNQFACRIGSGPPKSSEAQGDGAASTYAKRFALCNALNIVIENDSDGATDARRDGDLISKEKAQYLREQVKETGGNEAAFLKMAGASTYEEIREGSYPVLVRALSLKTKR
jgi:hypothetical protein